ncbi:hypothetical protein PS15m_012190 [Mucor circinelloides]
MISQELLDECSRQLMYATMKQEPFGGVLIIVFGDFGQLTPLKEDEKLVFRTTVLSRV